MKVKIHNVYVKPGGNLEIGKEIRGVHVHHGGCIEITQEEP